MLKLGRATSSFGFVKRSFSRSSPYASNPVEATLIKSPKDLASHLSKHIVGQEKAKKILSVAVFNHYHRIAQALEEPLEEPKKLARAFPLDAEPDPTKVHDPFGSKDPLEYFSHAPKPHLLNKIRTSTASRSRSASTRRASDDDIDGVEIEKSNVLMVGPTGSGKTLLAKTLAKILDIPFASCDATTFTQAGYVGEDVESSVLRLLQAADYDVDRTEMGIIHIDECDKLARRSGGGGSGRDVGGEGVQQALLRLLEGTQLTLTAKPPPQASTPPPPPPTTPHSQAGPSVYASDSGRSSPDEPLQSGFGPGGGFGLGAKNRVKDGLPQHGGGSGGSGKGEIFTVDTSNILFIVSGAFVGLDSIISRRQGKGSIGFGAPLPEPQRNGEFESWDEEGYESGARRKNALEGLSSGDLVEYGFIPEFVGRLPVLATLHALSLSDLIRVLTEPKNALIKQFRLLFKKYNSELRFSDSALLEIAKEASRRGGSARHLRGTVEEVLLDSMYEVPGSSIRYVGITAAVVRKEVPAHWYSRGSKNVFLDTLEADDRVDAKVETVIEEEMEEEERARATG